MVDTNISINFSDEDISDNYWIRLELIDPPANTVSLSEAATAIDAMFDVEPCTDEGASTGGQAADPFEIGDVPMILAKGFDTLNYDPCIFDEGTYDYSAVLFVYRSHVSIPYKLVVNSGSVTSTEKVVKKIKELVTPTGKVIETDYPITANLVCSEPIAEVNGSTIRLQNNHTGSLELSYETEYDKVTVHVPGTSSKSLSAECLAFYNGTVGTVTITVPEEDDQAIDLIECDPPGSFDEDEWQDEDGDGIPDDQDPDADGDGIPDINQQDPNDPNNAPDPCYQRYIFSQFCRCQTTTLVNSYSSVIEVPCPKSPATPHSNTVQGAYNFWWQAVNIIEYIPCADEAWDGYTEDFYIEKCCDPPDYTVIDQLPLCEIRKESWLGGTEIVKGADYYINNAFKNEIVVLVAVSPADGICGEITYIQEVDALQCCDDPTLLPLVYDDVNSADVLSDSSDGYVYWTGGKAPYTVTVVGTGFYLDPTRTEKTGQTDDLFAKIYTDDACGTATITIEGCTSDSGTLKSTDGTWSAVSTTCDYGVGNATYLTTANGTGSETVAYDVGNHRVSQSVYQTRANAGTYDPADTPPCDGDPCWQTLPYNGVSCPTLSSMCVSFDTTLLLGFEDWGCNDDCGAVGPPTESGGNCWYRTESKHYGATSIEEWIC